jgi:hypothetical protein
MVSEIATHGHQIAPSQMGRITLLELFREAIVIMLASSPSHVVAAHQLPLRMLQHRLWRQQLRPRLSKQQPLLIQILQQVNYLLVLLPHQPA